MIFPLFTTNWIRKTSNESKSDNNIEKKCFKESKKSRNLKKNRKTTFSFFTTLPLCSVLCEYWSVEIQYCVAYSLTDTQKKKKMCVTMTKAAFDCKLSKEMKNVKATYTNTQTNHREWKQNRIVYAIYCEFVYVVDVYVTTKYWYCLFLFINL